MFFDVGQMGIEHCLLPEKGIVLPGDVVIGADSHTCTYGALGAFCDRYGFHRYCHGDGPPGDIWMKVPNTIKFVYKGKLGKWGQRQKI